MIVGKLILKFGLLFLIFIILHFLNFANFLKFLLYLFLNIFLLLVLRNFLILISKIINKVEKVIFIIKTSSIIILLKS